MSDDEQEFDGETFPLPDDLKFSELVELSTKLADEIGDVLQGKEQVLAMSALMLMFKQGVKQVVKACADKMNDSYDTDVRKFLGKLIVVANESDHAVSKFMAIYPSLRIGKDYARQVAEYFEESDEDAVEIPTDEQLEELCDSLFSPLNKGDSDE